MERPLSSLRRLPSKYFWAILSKYYISDDLEVTYRDEIGISLDLRIIFLHCFLIKVEVLNVNQFGEHVHKVENWGLHTWEVMLSEPQWEIEVIRQRQEL